MYSALVQQNLKQICNFVHTKKEDFSFVLYSSALARWWLALLYSTVLSRELAGLSLLLPRVVLVRNKFSEDCLCHVSACSTRFPRSL